VSRLRAVLVGAGGMGRAWASVIAANPDVHLTGWVDLLKDRVAEAADELQLEHLAVEDDLEVTLNLARPDFVVDAAIPEAHHEITRRCLDGGIAVLGEKPMAATLEQARDLVARSERSSTLFMVSQNRRYNAGLATYRDLIAQHLGGIGQLSAEFYRAPHFGGFREEMDSPLLIDMAIHTFDAARYLTGANPLSVTCTEFNPPWSWYRGAASVVAEFELTGGIRFTYQGSWCAAGHETSWDSSWRAIGSAGTAIWDGSASPTAEVTDSAAAAMLTVVEPAPVALPGEGIAGALIDFVAALRSGRAPMGECHENIKSLAMVMSALESSRTGRRVATSS
jgi:predicted dehydrogenase